MANGSLYTQINQNIATVIFGHPSGNSFPSELLTRLITEINTLSENNTVKVIVLKSEGNTVFCSGASFDELLAITNAEEATAFFSGFANLLNAMRTCTKIIVASVQGKVVGGGLGIVAACDYALATLDATIKLSELAVGIGPFVIAPAVERKVGLANLSHLTLAPHEWKNAYWAEKAGFYAKVFETQKELDKELIFYTEKLATYSTDALFEIKKMLWQGTEHWQVLLPERAAISGKLVLTATAKNALQQFKK